MYAIPEQPDAINNVEQVLIHKEVHRQEERCLMQTAVFLNILSIFVLLYININFDTLKI
jgi:hypothetical protein